MSSWIGCGVSVNCGEPLGCYQGTIVEADGATITLVKAFRNGFPYPKPQVTLKASDIKDIQIIDAKTVTAPNEKKPHSTVEVSKVAKKLHKVSVSECVPSFENNPGTSQSLPGSSSNHMSHTMKYNSNYNGNQYNNGQHNQKSNNNGYNNMNGFQAATQGINNSKSKPIDIQGKQNKQNGGGSVNTGGTPNKKDNQRRRNEVCFGTPSDDPTFTQDFDFEKNLALFNKQALWEKLKQSQKPDVVRQTDHLRRNNQNFKHDENVLGSQPAMYRAITVPDDGRGALEYVTDDGLIVPSLTTEFRLRLLTACGKAGLGGAELLGRGGAEVALQLLGGTRRLNPRNTHQVPTVAFLIGPHRQGVVGVTCARHLASQGVSTVVLVAGADLTGALRPHLNMYQMTGNKLTTNILDLPSVDLIIIALGEDSDQPDKYPHLAEWTSQNRAPVLALDPPATGTPGIIAKYSLVPILPLSHSLDNGKLYLCNLAIPNKIFKDLGIEYSSPFGSKFVIALHPNDS